ncbi:hypothetical protein KGF54_004522 [Candida jiufengensis]|uniref:uncharacterized protein n=1 Tax=Candida jiufengensis TaxID=497108 RepID=UPI002224A076|nr:uncharacterized protein KGF54_004522 [Candida jiufengensis]KAI5951448.1 hypothetical protein KGF54_004522 [Candida jiufengensis]
MSNNRNNQQQQQQPKVATQIKTEPGNNSKLQQPPKSQSQTPISTPISIQNKNPAATMSKPNFIQRTSIPPNTQTTQQPNNLQSKLVQPQPKSMQYNQTTATTTISKPKLKPQQQQIRQQQPIAPKYTKIQPAIAPKPVSIMPSTSKFNPIPNGKILLPLKTSFTNDSNGGLNTSKKWVLPPRPRPGRKPTGNECEKITKTQINNNTINNNINNNNNSNMIKRKPKLAREMSNPANLNQTQGNTATINGNNTQNLQQPMVKLNEQMKSIPPTQIKQENNVMKQSIANPANSVSPAQNHPKVDKKPIPLPVMKTEPQTTVKKEQLQQPIPQHISKPAPLPTTTTTTPILKQSKSPTAAPPPPPPIKSNDPNLHMMELKMSYLSKLKEQEIIRNYIEVLKNQIKELSFVQNGVITFDALKNNVKLNNFNNNNTQTKKLITLSNTKPDQLDSINNLNDLNKFLNYLSKSSDIIKSVKKQQSSITTSESLNNQINNYVELRNKFKMLNNSNDQHTKYSKRTLNKKDDGTITPKTIGPTTSSFTPDLLRPLKASNLFNDPTLDLMDIELQTATIEESPTSSSDLMKPIDSPDKINQTTIDLVDQQSISNKYIINPNIEDIDFFVDEHDFLNKLVLEDKIKEEMELGKVEIYNKNDNDYNNNITNNDFKNNNNNGNGNDSPMSNSNDARNPIVVNDIIMKKKLKFNCGFCTNDTPCLCFDSDIEIAGLR